MKDVTKEAIVQFRLKFNLTQEALAAQLGVEHNTVSRWEKGHKIPPMVGWALLGLHQCLSPSASETARMVKDIDERAQKGVDELASMLDTLEKCHTPRKRVRTLKLASG